MNGAKRILPKSLFWRGLLIVALPLVLVQLTTVYIFFDRHVDSVSRYMRTSLVGEIAFLSELLSENRYLPKATVVTQFARHTQIQARFVPGHTLRDYPASRRFKTFRKDLDARIEEPFQLHVERGVLTVYIQFKDGVLILSTTAKRLESQTVDIFLLWSLGASFVCLLIALLFLRNQVRPIQQLAEASERFGKGQDVSLFKPSGAAEVRRAGRAFLVMQERIARQIRTRTQMLDGISHDLRTPLTRMNLQLALLPESKEREGLQEDIAQMEAMLTAYLQYTREGQSEEPTALTIEEILRSLQADFSRAGQTVTLGSLPEVPLMVREQAIKRALSNLVTNALRYGKKCHIHVQHAGPSRLELWVDDAGPGIPEALHEEVFRPFTRLDTARNLNAGGVGLGLTIARDIIRAHGGDIALSNSSGGGLRVVVQLPV